MLVLCIAKDIDASNVPFVLSHIEGHEMICAYSFEVDGKEALMVKTNQGDGVSILVMPNLTGEIDDANMEKVMADLNELLPVMQFHTAGVLGYTKADRTKVSVEDIQFENGNLMFKFTGVDCSSLEALFETTN